MNTVRRSRGMLLLSMLIFGSIGVFCRALTVPSSVTALTRAAVGFLALTLYRRFRGERLNLDAVKRNARFLLLAAVFLGFNWILLFEAYRCTTVAVATLCYYMAPVLVILASPLLGEKLSGKKLLCIAVALVGMALVSLSGGGESGSWKGILLGLAAAVLYASIILCNKKLKGISGMDRTAVQLGVSALVMLGYTLITGELLAVRPTPAEWGILTVLGVVHTGVAYALYFGSMDALPGQTVAICSYLDPVSALFFSVLLHEGFTLRTGLGAVLVLGATVFSELGEQKE